MGNVSAAMLELPQMSVTAIDPYYGFDDIFEAVVPLWRGNSIFEHPALRFELGRTFG